MSQSISASDLARKLMTALGLDPETGEALEATPRKAAKAAANKGRVAETKGREVVCDNPDCDGGKYAATANGRVGICFRCKGTGKVDAELAKAKPYVMSKRQRAFHEEKAAAANKSRRTTRK